MFYKDLTWLCRECFDERQKEIWDASTQRADAEWEAFQNLEESYMQEIDVALGDGEKTVYDSEKAKMGSLRLSDEDKREVRRRWELTKGK